MFQTLRRWERGSLASAFALRAALIAIGSSLFVALLFLGILYWTEQVAVKERLQDKAAHFAERVEGSIEVLESAISEMSRSPIFMTALLDSRGRAIYVEPFLANFGFPIPAASGLALCDLNGELMAGMRSPLAGCRADSPLFKRIAAGERILRELVRLENGHLAWVVYWGVVFSYTDTVEGVVVTQLDLNDLLRPVLKDLEVEAVALVRADNGETLASEKLSGDVTTPLMHASSPLFAAAENAAPFPIVGEVKERVVPFAGHIMPLLLGLCLGTLILIVVVVYWSRRVSRHAIAPLAELTGIAREIANTGNLDIVVPQTSVGEVSELAGAFEVMVNTLRVSEATLEKRVAQRTEDLRKSEEAAEAANRAKSQFLATMSHEIRTPMNGMLGMAQMLLLPNLQESERLDYACTILASGQMLLTLLNDILDLSKVEAGKFELESTEFEADHILREIQALFADEARTRKLTLDHRWSGAVGRRYKADAYRLRQMLTNLVANAIKFTAAGEVRIEAVEIGNAPHGDEVSGTPGNPDSAMLEFSVTDTGMGIAADKIDLLFKPFSQADSSTTRKFGGSGLGLSIVRSLANLMGGSAGGESTPGKGSRFWFRVRVGIIAAGSEDCRPQWTTRLDVPLPLESRQLRGRVLVVEDNRTSRVVVVGLLTKLGLQTVVAEDGRQAVLAATGGEAPDLVLMDLQLPVQDGYAATEQIRQWEAGQGRPRLPIIALTAEAFDSSRQRCAAVGVDDFLVKPIAFNAMHAVLARWLPAAPDSVPELNSNAAVVRTLDIPRFATLVNEITPLLAHNKFDAIGRYKALRSVAEGTPIAAEVESIEAMVATFRFDQALEHIRRIASTIPVQENQP